MGLECVSEPPGILQRKITFLPSNFLNILVIKGLMQTSALYKPVQERISVHQKT